MTTHPPDERLTTALLSTVALLALGHTLQLSNGHFDVTALRWLTFALVACWASAFLPPLRRLQKAPEELLLLVCGLGFAYQMSELLTVSPAPYLQLGPDKLVPFRRGLALAAVIGGAGLSARPWLGKLQPWLLVAVFFGLGVWLIQRSPDPRIDVHVFHREALKALFGGENPWAMRAPNIYGHSAFYGPGAIANGHLQVGFLYPPASLLLSAVGQLLGGDYRYAQLTCIALTGLLIAHMRPGRIGNTLAALLLFTPRVFFVLVQAWTEPYFTFCLALTVFLALRWPKAVPYALGMLLSVKQYSVVLVPLLWLIAPRPLAARALAVWALKAVAVAALVTLPFALWDWTEFYRAVVAFQVHQPFREDALSYLAYWVDQGNPAPSAAWGFVAALIALVLCLWRLPRNAFGFAAGVAVTYGVFFAFSKQAFCNYYYFVVGALAIAAASAVTAVAERRSVPLDVQQAQATDEVRLAEADTVVA